MPPLAPQPAAAAKVKSVTTPATPLPSAERRGVPVVRRTPGAPLEGPKPLRALQQDAHAEAAVPLPAVRVARVARAAGVRARGRRVPAGTDQLLRDRPWPRNRAPGHRHERTLRAASPAVFTRSAPESRVRTRAQAPAIQGVATAWSSRHRLGRLRVRCGLSVGLLAHGGAGRRVRGRRAGRRQDRFPLSPGILVRAGAPGRSRGRAAPSVAARHADQAEPEHARSLRRLDLTVCRPPRAARRCRCGRPSRIASRCSSCWRCSWSASRRFSRQPARGADRDDHDHRRGARPRRHRAEAALHGEDLRLLDAAGAGRAVRSLRQQEPLRRLDADGDADGARTAVRRARRSRGGM